MQLNLTEEQIQDRNEVFFTILDDFITEHYNVHEDYEMTEEDAYITSILWEYFCENFRWPTLKESAIEAMTHKDINHDLYEELAEILLDESVGKFVAGAAYGIRNWLSGRKASRATAQKQKAAAGFEKYRASPRSNKTIADVMQKKHDATNYGGGISGAVKKGYQQSKITAIQNKASAAKNVMRAAETKRKSAVAKHQVNVARSTALSNKIDTGIQNIKNKVKSSVMSGASKIGSVFGSAAGKFA